MELHMDGCTHVVCLSDDGTLDTCVDLDGHAVRFNQDYAAEYREPDGVLTDEGLERMLRDSHATACWNDDILSEHVGGTDGE